MERGRREVDRERDREREEEEEDAGKTKENQTSIKQKIKKMRGKKRSDFFLTRRLKFRRKSPTSTKEGPFLSSQ